MINKSLIIKQIESTLQFLDIHLRLANVHMVDYFTQNAFHEFIPINIQAEAQENGYLNTINTIYSQNTDSLPHIHRFFRKTQELTLKNTKICLSFDEFETKLHKLGCDIDHMKLNIFMSSKKSHEVEILSAVASAIQNLSQTSHLIDIGDGKGYLSSMLALHYKIPVLGVDSSEINTNGAVDRAKKLSKVWNGVVTNIKTRETSINLYKQITRFVDEKVDFPELISVIFLEKSDKLGLVGLHTCGNLTPTCLKIFKECPEIKTICNVGCCYHHLTEQPDMSETSSSTGFPLSDFLKLKKYALHRGARMIAAQSVDRILDKQERPSRAMFYRSLFEIVVEKHSQKDVLKQKQVGRFRKESPNFLDYVRKASKRIDMCLEMTDDEINKLYENYEHRIEEMDLFYLIRAMLAPVIETVILLDRLLYLFENGFENSFLIQFFDPVVSPRCYGIVSIKQ